MKLLLRLLDLLHTSASPLPLSSPSLTAMGTHRPH